jgi:integrase
MREGELFGLRWADVNLAAGSLHLVKQLKTRSSRRQILLVSVAVDALGRHLARQREERLLLGLEWDDPGLVFPNTVGKPLHPSNFLQRSFYPPRERAGLPRIRFHDLRHSAATLLLGLGIHPKIVSEMPGHSQIAITPWIYTPTSRLPCSRRRYEPSKGCLAVRLAVRKEPPNTRTQAHAPVAQWIEQRTSNP